jgi:3-hydroxyisobutyrate dehydrogenase
MKTGIIGLGAMGQHMARNLHRAGLLAGVWNRTTSKATALAAETGCRAFASPAELAPPARFVVTCVSADDRPARRRGCASPDAEARLHRHRLLDRRRG